MTMLKKIFSILFLILIFIFSSGNFISEASEIIYNLGADPKTIDPPLNYAIDGANVIVNIFEGLLRTGFNNLPEPACAESWEISDDGMTWIFKLRDNLKWSDGKEITAEDFKYGFLRLLDPEVASPYAYYGFFIKNGENFYNGKVKPEEVGLYALDDKTFKIELGIKNPLMLQYLSFAAFQPVRKDIIEKYSDSWANHPESLISNGPFKLESWKHGDGGEIVLAKNDFYWDSKNVKVDKIRMVFINNENTALAAFKAGKLDYMSNIPSVMLPLFLKSGEAVSLPSLGTAFCTFNVEKEPFNDVRVRRAFNLAIYRNVIVEKILMGGQKPATGLIPFEVSGTEAGKDFRIEGGNFLPEEADIVEAKRLLAEAGYPDGKGFPEVTYKYNSNPGNKMIAEVLQAMWKQNLGVQVQLHNEEWKVFLETKIKKDFQICRDAWILDFVDAANLLECFISDSPQNSGNYKNPEFDSLMKKAASEMDHKTRINYMHEAEKILMEDLPMLPIYFYNSAVMRNPRVKNIFRTVTGLIIFRGAEVNLSMLE